MSDLNESEMKKLIYKYGEIVDESSNELDKALMALNELINDYSFDLKLDVRKALEHDTTIGGNDDVVGKFTSRFVYDHDRIMWLIHVALDYCFLVSEKLKSPICE